MLAKRCIFGLALLPAVIGVTSAGCDTPTQESDEEGGTRRPRPRGKRGAASLW